MYTKFENIGPPPEGSIYRMGSDGKPMWEIEQKYDRIWVMVVIGAVASSILLGSGITWLMLVG
jgi:hypothetical protein